MITTDFRTPRYGEASLAEVLPSLLAGMDVPDQVDHLQIAGPRRAIVLLVDGLGSMWLSERADLVPFLAEKATGGGRRPQTIDSPCPSTTVTGIATLGTGRPPGEHGLVGYTLPGWETARRLNLLTWKFEQPGMDPKDALDEAPPETFQPLPTMAEVANAAGVTASAVLRSEYINSGITRAVLRGANKIAADGLADTLAQAVAAASASDRSLVYAHHGDIDRAGHGHGPETEPWEQAVADLDEALEHFAVDLPYDVDLYVTAGHGMVDVPPDGYLELADHPDLMAGVTVLAGEPRFRSLRCTPGAEKDVLAAWEAKAGHRFEVVSRAEAIEAGWFGPVVSERVTASLGEVLVLPRGMSAAVHRDLDPQWWRLSGHHGSLTRAEVEVPLVRVRRTG